jgi:hypothetical protein
MGCMHTNQRRPAIEGCGSLSYIRSVVKFFGKNNQKVGKIGQTIN